MGAYRYSEPRRRAPWGRTLLAVAAVAGAITASAPATAHASSPAGESSSVTVYAAGTTSRVSPSHAPAPLATSATVASRQHGSLPTRLPGAAVRALSVQTAPATAPAASKSRLLSNFNGVGSLDSAKTNFGAQFQPPDQGLCEGNGFVLEPVNSAYTVYTTSGHAILGPFNVNDMFNEGAAEFTSDPRCYYEAASHTWFALILFLSGGGAGNQSHFDLAVNTSGDPTLAWNEYRIDTTDAGGNGCPCFGDQPLFGVDQYNIYVSTNEFSILGPQFNGAQIYALDKTALLTAAPATVVHWSAPNIGGAQAASVQPATSNGTPDAEYLLNSLDPNGTGDTRIGVWAITHRDIHHGQAPVLSSVVLSSEAYALPVPTIQKGSATPLDPGDDRMQQTQWVGGSVYGELTTALTAGHDPTMRDGAAWFDVQPTLTGGVIGRAHMAKQGYVASAGNDLLYPALAADAQGRAAMVFTLTGAGHYPSAAYAVLGSGAAAFGAARVAAAGTGPYVPANPSVANRWGDYSYALVDPVTRSFWLATEYMPPKSSQTTDGTNNWGTRVLEVVVP